MNAHFEEVYLREILLQAEYAKLSIDAVNRVLRDGTPILVFRELQAFLSCVASISRLLWPPREQKSKGQPQTTRTRGDHLRTVLRIDETHPLRTRSLRDHLEHFDERLDQWVQETVHGGIVDLHLGPTWPIGGPGLQRKDFLRVFDPDRGVFTFRGDEFDVRALASAVEDVNRAVVTRMQTLQALAGSTVSG